MIKLEPALCEKIWGGHRLEKEYGKKNTTKAIGESWEVSCHKNGMSRIAEGPCAGMTLEDWLINYKIQTGENPLGDSIQGADFPVLIKFIDAAETLSIQVHPDDTYAQIHDHSKGKTEMWIILACEADAFLYYGVNKTLTKESFRAHIENHTILDDLQKVPVKKGDVFFIEAGTVHAISAGITICEIQQNSDTTYRVYDFNRQDKKGHTRDLHIDQAVAVSQLTPSPRKPGPLGAYIPSGTGSQQLLAACPYFRVTRYRCADTLTISLSPHSFLALCCTEGSGSLTLQGETLHLTKGESVFIPALSDILTVTGTLELIGTCL